MRQRALAGEVSADTASLVHRDLLSLGCELFPHSPCAARVWEVRSTVTAYDAWYVALAEALSVPLATLDARLTRATGPRCALVVPPTWPTPVGGPRCRPTPRRRGAKSGLHGRL